MHSYLIPLFFLGLTACAVRPTDENEPARIQIPKMTEAKTDLPAPAPVPVRRRSRAPRHDPLVLLRRRGGCGAGVGSRGRPAVAAVPGPLRRSLSRESRRPRRAHRHRFAAAPVLAVQRFHGGVLLAASAGDRALGGVLHDRGRGDDARGGDVEPSPVGGGGPGPVRAGAGVRADVPAGGVGRTLSEAIT